MQRARIKMANFLRKIWGFPVRQNILAKHDRRILSEYRSFCQEISRCSIAFPSELHGWVTGKLIGFSSENGFVQKVYSENQSVRQKTSRCSFVFSSVLHGWVTGKLIGFSSENGFVLKKSSENHSVCQKTSRCSSVISSELHGWVTGKLIGSENGLFWKNSSENHSATIYWAMILAGLYCVILRPPKAVRPRFLLDYSFPLAATNITDIDYSVIRATKQWTYISARLFSTQGRRRTSSTTSVIKPKAADPWKKPPKGKLKFNLDATHKMTARLAAIGGLIRNHRGKVKLVLQRRLKPVLHCSTAEFLALFFGLKTCIARPRQFPLHKVIFEVDNKEVWYAVKKRTIPLAIADRENTILTLRKTGADNETVQLISQKINVLKLILPLIPKCGIDIRWVNRKKNRLADGIADKALALAVKETVVSTKLP